MRQFVESLKRLYVRNLIQEQKINELFDDKKITEDEKGYILNIDKIES